MAVKIIPALLLHDGAPGSVLQTDALGNLVWDVVPIGSLAVGVPGQQIFAAPGTGVATWQTPLGHSEETSLVAGLRETNAVVQTGQSQVSFDPSTLATASGGLTRTIRLQATVWATFGMTAEIELYNLTDAGAVATTLLTTASTVPVLLESPDLAVPATLPNAARIYELRLRISAGVPGPADRAFLSQARLQVRWS